MQQHDPEELLRPALQDVEERLKDRLGEICAANEISDESTGELIRLEESLSMATESAKEAVTLRRKLRQAQGSHPNTGSTVREDREDERNGSRPPGP